jgi:hypothetical protein
MVQGNAKVRTEMSHTGPGGVTEGPTLGHDMEGQSMLQEEK